jgi:dTDP-4-dehydrorhamnose reductase
VSLSPHRVLLLGSNGYVGSQFLHELRSRGHEVVAPRSRDLELTAFDAVINALREIRPAFVFNSAGYTGKPNVDACESDRAGTLRGNVVLPQSVAQACASLGIPWGHVSSGCIFSGARLRQDDGTLATHKNLTDPSISNWVRTHRDRVVGFTEEDTPNFSFRDGPCSFYSGTKALGEEAIAHSGNGYIWRLRIPFDNVDSPRNYLSKLRTYPKVYDNFNSISHRGDFARACVDCWEKGVPWGTYNITNPGFVSTSEVVDLLRRTIDPSRSFQFWADDAEFYRQAARTPRSNCVMDSGKLMRAGISIRPVAEALEHSLAHWIKA